MKGKERRLVVTRKAAALSFCSSLNYPAEGSSAQRTSSCGGTVLVRTDAREHRTSESRKNNTKKAAAPRSLHAQQSRANPTRDGSPSVTCRVALTSERSERRTLTCRCLCRRPRHGCCQWAERGAEFDPEGRSGSWCRSPGPSACLCPGETHSVKSG